ncbi:phosphopantetheine-binding protein [Pseudomonas sp. G166]|uniref:acyl carrier protein n=1 Tax=Pseudomonas sp. G166 TaxID=3094846 RepID=UPI0030CBDC96
MGGRNVEVGLRLIEDLYIDSMSLVEIVMMLNEMFSIELPAEGVGMCRTVKDICDLVEKSRVWRRGVYSGVNESRM